MSIAENLDNYAESVYIKDSTGENFIENIIHTANLPSLLGKIGEKNRILELGYGEGTITSSLVERGYRVEIVEGSAKLCQAARERFGSKIVVHESLFESFKPTQLYDAIFALHIFEHVEFPSAVIHNMVSWLSPDGRVVAVVPNAESLHRQLAVIMGMQEAADTLSLRDKLVGHQRVYTLDKFVADFESAGLKVEERFGYFVKIVPNSMMSEWSPDLLCALTHISDKLPSNLLANIGIVARKPDTHELENLII
ncbi:MAG: class I SAM-dependent methyltransferase [Chlorobium sp.]